jgi:hypothetical protein
MFRAGAWVSVVKDTSNRPHWEAVAITLNQVFYYSFLVTIIALAANFAWELYKIFRGKPAIASEGCQWRSAS